MLFVAASVLSLFAQTPDFSGTWELDRDASRINPAAVLARLGEGGTPGMLHITHAANGTVIVSSEVNESQSRAYKVDSRSSIPVDQAGSMTVTSRWEDGMLVAEGAQEAGASTITGLKRVLSLSPDGQTLTFEITTARPKGENTSTLLYRRAQVVSPCQNWSTPCK